MMAPPALDLEHARLDRDGRLISADSRLLQLVEQAGGGLGQPLPHAPLRALVGLAGRLGIAITRKLTLADADATLELDARAQPTGEGMTLALAGWHFREPRRLADVADFTACEAGWGWACDATLALTHLSPAAQAEIADPAAALGHFLTDSFRLVESDDGALPMLLAVASRRPFTGQRALVRQSQRWLTLSGTPQLDAAGGFRGFTGVAAPIRPLRGDALLGAGFGARLDRSLRAPLERIVATAGSMSAEVDGPLAADYLGYARDIVGAGRHLLGLVDDLVDLEAIERDDFAVEAEPIDLADVARRAAGLLAVRASDARVTIDRPKADEALPCAGDFGRALQVCVNLIGNAIRYSPAGASVWVRGEADSGRACVTVADQGKGIAPDDQARIFDKFARIDPAEPGGSGLGLYISRRLARAMGGDITVDSAAGQGARFTFWLPEGPRA